MPTDNHKPDTEDISPIQRGVTFETVSDRNCIALGKPDILGTFHGMDGNGEIRTFTMDQVYFIKPYQIPLIEI